ncbi:MAG TPA: glycosyltransferase family 39 protein, partial [Aggregatilineales bacterium]|nr:glycosyltransferase family 39 protein [Aggregatilineales bacterium]
MSTGLIGGALIATSRAIHLPRVLSALRSNAIVRPVGLLIGIAVVAAIWLTPSQDSSLSSLQREAIRGWEMLVVLAIVYAGLFWQADDVAIPWPAWFMAATVIGAAIVIVAFHYLDRFPQINLIDELHNWSVQWTFAHTGLLGESMYRQMIPLPQPMYESTHYLGGFLLRFFGDTFWQARFARLLLTLLALPFIYLSGKRMYGARAGLFAVVFALLLIVPVDYVRPDFFVGLTLSVGIYLYLRAQTTRRPWLHYLTGLCVALGGEGHALAYRFGIALAFLYGIRWLYEMWTTRRLFLDGRLVALGLGGATGMMIFLGIHILPNLDQGLHFAENNAP